VSTSNRSLHLAIRCVAFRRASLWHVHSLEFGLSTCAETFADARVQMHGLIHDFLHYALVGEDGGHTNDLIYRRAGWKPFAWFYLARLTEWSRLAAWLANGLKTYCDPWDSEQLGSVRSRLQRSLAELGNRHHAAVPPRSAPLRPSLDLIYRSLH
jgi:hypothetical protein